MQVTTKVGEGGRIVIPANYRKELGISSGDDIVMILEDGEIRLVTPKKAMEYIRGIVRQYVPGGTRLVDEFLEDRRAEAANE